MLINAQDGESSLSEVHIFVLPAKLIKLYKDKKIQKTCVANTEKVTKDNFFNSVLLYFLLRREMFVRSLR